jgi:hypothetical protein
LGGADAARLGLRDGDGFTEVRSPVGSGPREGEDADGALRTLEGPLDDDALDDDALDDAAASLAAALSLLESLAESSLPSLSLPESFAESLLASLSLANSLSLVESLSLPLALAEDGEGVTLGGEGVGCAVLCDPAGSGGGCETRAEG